MPTLIDGLIWFMTKKKNLLNPCKTPKIKQYSLVFFLTILFFDSIGCYSQTKPLTEVEVDLGSGVVKGPIGLPYDVPFRFKGTVLPSFREITLTYKVSDSYGDTANLQWKGDGSASYSSWKYLGDQKEWRLSVGQIHPNVPYDFIFEIKRVPDLNSPEIPKFKEEVYRILEKFYEDPNKISAATIISTNALLNSQLKALVPPNQEIINPDGSPYKIDIYDYPYNTLLETIQNVQDERLKLKTRLTSLKNIFLSEDFDYDGFRLRLAKIIIDPNSLNPESKEVIEAIIDGGNSNYNSVKMVDFGNLVIHPSHRIFEIFEGTVTVDLDNYSWVASSKPDVDLMKLTFQFYSNIQDNLILNSGKEVFTDDDMDNIELLLNFLNDITKAQVLFRNQLTEIKNNALNKFPNVLADKMLSASYVVSDQSYTDAVSQSTPYIGLDFGFSYIPGYSQLFIYEGVNFYFMPVNKDAPLSYFTKRRYWWLKRLSIHFGLTQNLIKVENDRYSPLIEGIGSVLAGAGFRINRIMRINAGYMFFYEKDNNPLKDKKHFTALPQLSFTFDINIAKALGGVGKRMSIDP